MSVRNENKNAAAFQSVLTLTEIVRLSRRCRAAVITQLRNIALDGTHKAHRSIILGAKESYLGLCKEISFSQSFGDLERKAEIGYKEYFDSMERPRTIKTHLPVQLLPDDLWITKPKIIFMSRDPRDVAVSMFHYLQHYDNSLSLEKVLEKFLSDQLILCPYREFRLNFLNIPDYPNILYMTYEAMTSNIDEAIQKVADFLGVKVSQENLRELKTYLRFDSMKSIAISKTLGDCLSYH